MKFVIVVFTVIVILLSTSCTTTDWKSMSQGEQRTAIVLGVASILYAGGMVYWIMNPAPVPDDWGFYYE